MISVALVLAFVSIVLLALVAGLIGHFFPAFSNWVLHLIGIRSPTAEQALRAKDLTTQALSIGIALAFAAWCAVAFILKRLFRSAWLKLVRILDRGLRPAPVPAGCFALSTLADVLFPQMQNAKREISFVGREQELAWLHRQCQLAAEKPGSRVVSVWGAQGIGKTHLVYKFARSLVEGAYSDCFNWAAYRLDRNFAVGELLVSLPLKPVLLLLDDFSLSDDASRKRLQDLARQTAAKHKPLLILLTTWQQGRGNGLAREELILQDEIQIGALPLAYANQLFPSARTLASGLQGHPLMLRLMAERGHSGKREESAPDLWQACLSWADGFQRRLRTEHGISEAALQALALVASSDVVSWNQLSHTCNLSQEDFRLLEKTGRVARHQGAPVLTPLRPDLLGWAFAIKVFESRNFSELGSFAAVAWEADFFDTGRFIVNATTQQLQNHPWVCALQAPTLSDSQTVAALSRAKAATNAVNHYGGAQMWAPMQAELGISQAIALRFSGNAEIQLSRAKAANNAVSDYGGAQMWPPMQAELDISQAIALRFSDHLEIQLVRAQAATNAVNGYGGAQMWAPLQAELDISQAIAMRFSDHPEIQLARAKAAINTVNHYGGAQMWPPMQAELDISQAVALRFSDHPEIQLVRAQAAAHAVNGYGGAQMWAPMQAELGISKAIGLRFSDHPEIQLRLALCLLTSLISRRSQGLDIQEDAHELFEHMNRHPYLWTMPPFDKIFAGEEPTS